MANDVDFTIQDALSQALINPYRPYPITIEQWKANVGGIVQGMCRTFPELCPNGFPQGKIDAAGEVLRAALANRDAGVNDVTSPLYYGIDTPIRPNDVLYVAPNQTPTYATYSPTAGWVPATGSGPNTTSPTIPAFTSPSNATATMTGSPIAASGGSDVVGTAAGIGVSQGGSGTLQSTLNTSPGSSVALASLMPGAGNTNLLIILLALAVAVIIFGRR